MTSRAVEVVIFRRGNAQRWTLAALRQQNIFQIGVLLPHIHLKSQVIDFYLLVPAHIHAWTNNWNSESPPHNMVLIKSITHPNPFIKLNPTPLIKTKSLKTNVSYSFVLRSRCFYQWGTGNNATHDPIIQLSHSGYYIILFIIKMQILRTNRIGSTNWVVSLIVPQET